MNSEQKQNIFVVHTPFQVYISEMMVGTLDEFAGSRNILLLEFNKPFEHINYKLWFDVIALKNIGNSTFGNKNYIKCENNIGLIRTLVEVSKRSCLFLSDIAWPLNNRLFFDRRLRKKVVFCLFSDGLGTYLFAKITKMLFFRGIAKQLNGILHRGVKYQNYCGSQFGVDRKEIKYIYAPNVSFVNCDASKKKEVLSASIERPPFDHSKCIFIETNGWLVVSEKDWHVIRANTVRFLKSLGVDIYYKNHPFGRKQEQDYYQHHGFNIIEDNRCAELIIAEEGFGVVVSYFSSTLFNLKSMYQESVRCIALSNNILTSSTAYYENKFEEVYKIFAKVNIEVVKL